MELFKLAYILIGMLTILASFQLAPVLFKQLKCVDSTKNVIHQARTGGKKYELMHNFRNHTELFSILNHGDANFKFQLGHDAKITCKPKLAGLRTVYLKPDFNVLDSLNKEVQMGGKWRPKHCVTYDSTAIIVPFRNREWHLIVFLQNLHEVLQAQMISYQIFVVEQMEKQKFNRGKLMNIGFLESLKHQNFSCIIFHDVDLFPESDLVPYKCSKRGPIHLASAMDSWKYRLPYGAYIGGVTAFTTMQFWKINGFSNNYWGWGGEDDDSSIRIGQSNQTIVHLPETFARFKMFQHKRDSGNEPNVRRVYQLRQTKRVWKNDGLISLDYLVRSSKQFHLYTWIMIDALQPNETQLEMLFGPPKKAAKNQTKQFIASSPASSSTTVKVQQKLEPVIIMKRTDKPKEKDKNNKKASNKLL